MTTNDQNSNDVNNDYDKTARSIIRNWLIITSPFACVTWMLTHSFCLVITIILFIPTLAVLQGVFWIMRFRLFYGNSPHPLSTAHGVVVVHPESRTDFDNYCDNNDASVNKTSGCNCVGGRRWRNVTNEGDERILQKAATEPPLRLLCLGDSLAVGVGISKSCTPVLPEIIARSLSKSMDGRAVFWTSHGKSGASTGWIARELERGIKSNRGTCSTSVGVSRDSSSKKPEQCLSLLRCESDLSETDGSSVSESSCSDTDEEETLGLYPSDFGGWRERLQQHKKRFDPECLGPYDVVVIFTGPNDLKSTFFPFLLTGEDAEFRRQARERGGSIMELKRVLDILADRMKLRIRISLDHLQKSVERALPDNIKERIHLPSSPSSLASNITTSKTIELADEKTKLNVDSTVSNEGHLLTTRRPIIVLPGMPAESLPIFQAIPIRWAAIPMVALMDKQKRALAKAHPDEIIFVEEPKPTAIAEFEAQRGKYWRQRCEEDAILNLRHVTKSTCETVLLSMDKFYNSNQTCAEAPDIPQHNPPVPPLSELPGLPGSKIFTADAIHPNDEGYEFWARHIADGIVKQWNK